MELHIVRREDTSISKHLKDIFDSGELAEEAAVSILETTAADGKNYSVNRYSLDAILAVGYRVRSQRGAQFRRWATERLREYLVKGFTMDDQRLKGRDRLAEHFDELLARLRRVPTGRDATILLLQTRQPISGRDPFTLIFQNGTLGP